MHTKQETFDTVVGALLKQGKPSMNESLEGCTYRGPNGLKCAVGHLIPDELYDPKFEGQGICVQYSGRPVNEISALMIKLGYDLHLLQDLQIIHDDSCPYHDWLNYVKRKFKKLAEVYDLNWKFEST